MTGAAPAPAPAFQFAAFDTAVFLRDCWQQKPCLIRNPWVAWANPLDPDDLAGLACEPGVESRMIHAASERLAVEPGPLAEESFARPGKAPWTLLVQGVDQHVPEVAALIAPFRFIPDWRIDDVMVSYAVDGGGVGAHFDHYDVFLVQGLGKRRWQVGGLCNDSTELLEHDDLRLLADFQPLDEWILEPGDILYVPPGFAHNGTAVGDDCMTFSVGFRAPSHAELLSGWTEAALDGLTDDSRYVDALPFDRANPGEITAAELDRLHAMAIERLSDRAAFARWFGEHTTAPKNPDIDWRPETGLDAQAIARAIASGAAFSRNPAHRFAFVRTGPDALELFVDGHMRDCRGPLARFAEALCRDTAPVFAPELAGSAEVVDLLTELVNAGSIAPEYPAR